jgi:hypothetical protein
VIVFDAAEFRRVAADYLANPTPGRAQNAAQRLTSALDEIDRLQRELAARKGGGS